jgi:SAM-dependent methyltransferase
LRSVLETEAKRLALRMLRRVSHLKSIGKDYGDDELNQKMTFQCNICGRTSVALRGDLTREQVTCIYCGSTMRLRSIIHLLSTELFGESLLLSEFPENRNIKGVGMSDWEEYADVLKQKLGYTNTYYDKEPRLDIKSIDPEQEGKYDFIISTDVFEHVSPPVSVAFDNCRRLLKPGGFMVFSAPYIDGPGTIEHFPDLYDYKIINRKKPIMVNITYDGVRQEFHEIRFHGGEGSTLQMRLFSRKSLIDEFRRAGFDDVRVMDQPYYKYGILRHGMDNSFPMIVKLKKSNDTVTPEFN